MLKRKIGFIVVSEVYPTPTTEIADVILPSAMWFEREGMFGNSERRTQTLRSIDQPPGEAMSDGLQIMEVAKRMGYGEFFPWTQENYIEKFGRSIVNFTPVKNTIWPPIMF